MSEPVYIDPKTNETFPLDAARWCAPSGAPLMVSPLPGMTRAQIDPGERSLWRYAAAMPLAMTDPISMGEGCTPLIDGVYDDVAVKLKLEWFAPTGSFKDRGAAVLISFLKHHGITAVCEDSSGNGGAAIAGFGAKAGMTVHILVPAHTQPAKIAQVRAYGAHITLVPGPREATEAAAIEMAETVFYASHNWHPMFLQGTKTLGYEIWEDLGFRVPDNIVIPAGAGSNVIGCYLAFTELKRAGEIDCLPRLFVTQPAHCDPLHQTFQAGTDICLEIEPSPTIAEGTAIRKPIRTGIIMAALRETKGGTASLSEAEIEAAALALARRGIYVEPTCAHAAAGFSHLLASGEIEAEQETVLVMTGTGLKATPFYDERLGR